MLVTVVLPTWILIFGLMITGTKSHRCPPLVSLPTGASSPCRHHQASPLRECCLGDVTTVDGVSGSLTGALEVSVDSTSAGVPDVPDSVGLASGGTGRRTSVVVPSPRKVPSDGLAVGVEDSVVSVVDSLGLSVAVVSAVEDGVSKVSPRASSWARCLRFLGFSASVDGAGAGS